MAADKTGEPPRSPSRIIPPLPDVVGHSLDGRIYTIDADENRRLCESLGVAPDRDGRAHPIYAYIGTQVGMGETIEGLCQLCDFDVNAGLMLGSCDVHFLEPLEVSIPYRVRGTVVGIKRKASRRLGTMDVLEYSLSLEKANGTVACTITNTWILPRGQGHDA